MSKSKEALFTQVKLVRPLAGSDYANMTTWVDADPKRLQRGVVITLKKHPNEKWMVEEVYDTKTSSDIDNRGFDNNDYSKHEGLKI